MGTVDNLRILTALGVISVLQLAGAEEDPNGDAGPPKPASIEANDLSDEELDALIDGDSGEAAARRWETEITFTGVSGYNDNVLQGPFREDASVFYGGSAEAFFWRLPSAGKMDFYTYLLADTVRYPDAESIGGESLVLVQSRLSKSITDQLTAGTILQYVFADQVYDVSATELESETTQLRFQQWSGRLYAERKFAGTYFFTMEGAIKRLEFRESSDDYTAPALKFTVRKPLKHRSKISFSYEIGSKDYDEREQRDGNGDVVEMTELKWTWHEFVLDWRQKWGKNQNLSTATKLFWKLNRDNGSGYYDFDRYGIKEAINLRIGNWEISGEVKLSQYDYFVQVADSGDSGSGLYSRTDIRANTRLSKDLSDRFKLFCEYSREFILSERASDEFIQNRWFVGVERTF